MASASEKALQGRELVELVASGLSLRRAAEAKKIEYHAARSLFQAQLAEVADDYTREQVLQQELVTLGLLQRKFMQQALTGDVQSAKVVLSIQDRRAKYLGLDEAIKVNVDMGAIDGTVTEIRDMVAHGAEVVPLRRVEGE